jgi:hypothetical protein
MFRCRSFPGQYLLLTLDQKRRSVGSSNDRSRNSGVRHSPVVTDRGYFGPCDFGPRQAEMPVPRRPFPGDEMDNKFAGGDARWFLRRARVRVLPQPSGRVAQLAEQDRCRQFPGEYSKKGGHKWPD